MESEFNQRFAKIEGEIKLLTWMVGFNLAATVGVFFMLCATDAAPMSRRL